MANSGKIVTTEYSYNQNEPVKLIFMENVLFTDTQSVDIKNRKILIHHKTLNIIAKQNNYKVKFSAAYSFGSLKDIMESKNMWNKSIKYN